MYAAVVRAAGILSPTAPFFRSLVERPPSAQACPALPAPQGFSGDGGAWWHPCRYGIRRYLRRRRWRPEPELECHGRARRHAAAQVMNTSYVDPIRPERLLEDATTSVSLRSGQINPLRSARGLKPF